MSGNRNVLFLIIGALIVGIGVLGYNLYQEKEAGGPADQSRAERRQGAEQITDRSMRKAFALGILTVGILAVVTIT